MGMLKIGDLALIYPRSFPSKWCSNDSKGASKKLYPKAFEQQMLCSQSQDPKRCFAKEVLEVSAYMRPFGEMNPMALIDRGG